MENESERVNISGVTAVSGDSTAQLLNYNRSTVGNFNFFNRSSSYDSFMYLVGGHDEVRTYRIMDTQESLISDGINHLVYDNGQLKNTVTGSNATSWTFEAVSNKYYIYTSPDSITKYYLYYNN